LQESPRGPNLFVDVLKNFGHRAELHVVAVADTPRHPTPTALGRVDALLKVYHVRTVTGLPQKMRVKGYPVALL
jgi:hypothetical protein